MENKFEAEQEGQPMKKQQSPRHDRGKMPKLYTNLSNEEEFKFLQSIDVEVRNLEDKFKQVWNCFVFNVVINLELLNSLKYKIFTKGDRESVGSIKMFKALIYSHRLIWKTIAICVAAETDSDSNIFCRSQSHKCIIPKIIKTITIRSEFSITFKPNQNKVYTLLFCLILNTVFLR